MTNFIDGVSAKRAKEICGFRTVAMLDYLERSGVMLRKGGDRKRKGKGRRYDFRELLVLKVIANLLHNGASVAALKKSLHEFQKEKWVADKGSLSIGDNKIRYLSVASGGKIIFADSNNNFYDMTGGGQMMFSFIIDMDRLHTELCSDWDQGMLALPRTR
jgi:DNA-binding transcriptional MerR regulator